MTDLTSTGTFIDAIPNLGVKKIYVETPATADAADTIKVTLGSYGIREFKGITEHIHTTYHSVTTLPGVTSVAGAEGSYEDNSTVAVASGVLTITIGTRTDAKHVYEVLGT